MIIFKKILLYDLKPEKGNVFSYLTRVGLQTIDPPSKAPGRLELHTKIAYHSTQRRAVECLKMDQKLRVIPLNTLREVVFDLGSMCSEAEFQKGGSAVVRRKFKDFFIEDRLPQSRAELCIAVRSVLEECAGAGEDVTIVSHSFRLKLFEAYLKTEGRIVQNPALIENFIIDDRKTYEFGGGFEYPKD